MKTYSDLGFDPSKLSKQKHDELFLNFKQLEKVSGLSTTMLRMLIERGQLRIEPYRFVSPHYSHHANCYFKIDEIPWDEIKKKQDYILRKSVRNIERMGYRVTLNKSPVHNSIGG